MTHQLLHAMNWQQMSTEDIVLILVLGGSIALIMAWLTDVLMERLSFGVMLNALLMILGAMLGFAVLVWAGFPPTRRGVLPVLFACGLSGVLTLMLVACFKRPV